MQVVLEILGESGRFFGQPGDSPALQGANEIGSESGIESSWDDQTAGFGEAVEGSDLGGSTHEWIENGQRIW